jgi:hypothetical protein
MPTIDRHGWISARIRFLEDLLGSDPPEGQRLAAESELQQLHEESALGGGRLRRWLTGIRLPHER